MCIVCHIDDIKHNTDDSWREVLSHGNLAAME